MKILITSTQYPYYGGSATNSYALIKYFREYGCSSAGIFFDNHSASVDPDKIGGVWRHKGNGNKNLIKKIVTRYLKGYPDIILAKNYAAPVYSKDIFQDIPVVYMVTGSPHMIELSKRKISAQRYLLGSKKNRFKPEELAVKRSDFVLPNSELGKKFLIKHYGKNPKILNPLDTSMALNNISDKDIPFDRRKYDIMFVVSNLNRDVKNAQFALTLFKKFQNSSKVVIGNNNQKFKSIPNTKIYNLLEHKKLMNLMSNTKLVICTSYYDASPNVIKEAISFGCNILISQNCGWNEIYPKEFVTSDVYSVQEWSRAIQYLIQNNVEYSIPNKNKDLIFQSIKGLV